jgi:hypothetical protein
MTTTTKTRNADLTQEQLTALHAYAAQHGRCWKQELRWQWMDASAEPVLHQLRNSHGPSWLIAFRLTEVAR